jgi:hypothetical protein
MEILGVTYTNVDRHLSEGGAELVRRRRPTSQVETTARRSAADIGERGKGDRAVRISRRSRRGEFSLLRHPSGLA